MTKEEAIYRLQNMAWLYGSAEREQNIDAIDKAIEALQTDIVRCENCKHQDECEEIVLFEVTDDEVIGHRVHWCSYGRSK